MRRALHLSPDLSIPAEAVTETFAILAVRGAGKTNAARVMAEEMHAAGLPFVAVDPVGSWWGLRAGRDGAQGIPIPIFGGRHGDVPLERGGGALVADLVVDRRLSCVLDLSQMESEAAKKEFLLAFATRLYQRNTEPLHLFLEECDDFIPQRPMKDELRLLRAWENIVRRGRSRGLGMTLITQRSAVVAKNVLTQVGTLITLRTTSPQDRAAVSAWVDHNGADRQIVDSLPGLESGEAWVWSPSFLKKTVRVRFRRSSTFDSGATPSIVASRRAQATLADVDLDAVRVAMAETIERSKAEDPAVLRSEVARLRAEVKRLESRPQVEKVVEVSAVSDGQVQQLMTACDSLRDATRVIRESLLAAGKPGLTVKRATPEAEKLPPARAVRALRSPSHALSGFQRSVSTGERALLTALVQSGGATREELTVLAGYRRSSRDTYLQRLTSRGLVEGNGDGRLAATDLGRAALGSDYEPLPTGDKLLAWWMARLSVGEQAILSAVVRAYPQPVQRDVIDCSYKRSSRDTYLQRLSARRLVSFPSPGMVRAADELF